VYARMLGDKMREHQVNVWLINTGWTGGSYGVGHRINLSHTRALIKAALENKLAAIDFENHPVFGFAMPKECPGVPSEILNPRKTWNDKNAYEEKANYLASLFIKNFEKYSNGVTDGILAAAPKKNL
jgi:phosphoenolpyruvate carboxykinase (ATP)